MNENINDKIKRLSAQSLSDKELSKVLFGADFPGVFASQRAMSRCGFDFLVDSGFSAEVAAKILAYFELNKRYSLEIAEQTQMDEPLKVANYLKPILQAETQEVMVLLSLDSKMRLIQKSEIYRGTETQCFASPKSILREALSHSAEWIVVAHNHPSGDCGPSEADLQATKLLRQACKTVGIELADHVIIGSNSNFHPDGYYSFREAGLL